MSRLPLLLAGLFGVGVVMAAGCGSGQGAGAAGPSPTPDDDAGGAPSNVSPTPDDAAAPSDASDAGTKPGPEIQPGTWDVLTRSGFLNFGGFTPSGSRFSGLAVDPSDDDRFVMSAIAQVDVGSATAERVQLLDFTWKGQLSTSTPMALPGKLIGSPTLTSSGRAIAFGVGAGAGPRALAIYHRDLGFGWDTAPLGTEAVRAFPFISGSWPPRVFDAVGTRTYLASSDLFDLVTLTTATTWKQDFRNPQFSGEIAWMRGDPTQPSRVIAGFETTAAPDVRICTLSSGAVSCAAAPAGQGLAADDQMVAGYLHPASHDRIFVATTSTSSAGGRLYASADGAQSFKRVAIPSPCSASPVFSFAGHPGDADTFAIAVVDMSNVAHVYATHDGGKTLVDVPLPTAFITTSPPIRWLIDGLAIDRQGRLSAVVQDALIQRTAF